MKFQEIARFLNITEMVAKSLGKQGVLPGRPYADGWNTTLDEIERWYVKLSGEEWADLTSGGKIDPIISEIDLECEVTTEALLIVLRSWEQKGIVNIISHNLGLEPSGNPEIVVTLCEAADKGRNGIESLEHTALIKSVRSQIEIVYRCQNIIGKNPARVSLEKQRILKIGIENDMTELPQREREIIRFNLATYALRLSTELREEFGHKTRNKSLQS